MKNFELINHITGVVAAISPTNKTETVNTDFIKLIDKMSEQEKINHLRYMDILSKLNFKDFNLYKGTKMTQQKQVSEYMIKYKKFYFYDYIKSSLKTRTYFYTAKNFTNEELLKLKDLQIFIQSIASLYKNKINSNGTIGVSAIAGAFAGLTLIPGVNIIFAFPALLFSGVAAGIEVTNNLNKKIMEKYNYFNKELQDLLLDLLKLYNKTDSSSLSKKSKLTKELLSLVIKIFNNFNDDKINYNENFKSHIINIVHDVTFDSGIFKTISY
ncbi:hypothetical protein [Mycoplasmopsis alligatoris]|uniref:Uncharacterized protein n=1 Tax=Mycoplasmopsis alligatoris A21JP2 TaxID=747682 RepID=D4XWQ7_9BACT|nr:hypothetical protein [Mycoplasmopsis alligatoris]EFF41135.1 hypothetical protein MALL_0371 [Mycoplasmopsis alligatoris A21JP2]